MDDDEGLEPVGHDQEGEGDLDAPRRCPKCQSSRISSEGRGFVCLNCANVIEESTIVSDLTFVDASNGTSNVVGQFFSHSEMSRMRTRLPGQNRESREHTFQQGKATISELVRALKATNHVIDTCHRFFQMAVHKNFIQGRKTGHVIAVCVYLGCRLHSEPIMLIDISDITKIDVVTLGHTYLKLGTLLHLQASIPVLDPSIYIERFASKLNFGEKQSQVVRTTILIVQRMKRDWLHTGRRPNGICGAAILIGARMHGFNRSEAEIVEVVRICEPTLRKRLMEFGKTPAGSLTAQEFESVDLEEECDPPAFIAAQKKREIEAERELASRIQSQQQTPQQEIQKQMEISQSLPQSLPQSAIHSQVATPQQFPLQTSTTRTTTATTTRTTTSTNVMGMNGTQSQVVGIIGSQMEPELEDDVRQVLKSGELEEISKSISQVDLENSSSMLDMEGETEGEVLSTKKTSSKTPAKTPAAHFPTPNKTTPATATAFATSPNNNNNNNDENNNENNEEGIEELPQESNENEETTLLSIQDPSKIGDPDALEELEQFGNEPNMNTNTNMEGIDPNAPRVDPLGPNDVLFDFDDVPDKLVDQYINSHEEAEAKAKLWNELNKDYLALLEKKKAEEEEKRRKAQPTMTYAETVEFLIKKRTNKIFQDNPKPRKKRKPNAPRTSQPPTPVSPAWSED